MVFVGLSLISTNYPDGGTRLSEMGVRTCESGSWGIVEYFMQGARGHHIGRPAAEIHDTEPHKLTREKSAVGCPNPNFSITPRTHSTPESNQADTYPD